MMKLGNSQQLLALSAAILGAAGTVLATAPSSAAPLTPPFTETYAQAVGGVSQLGAVPGQPFSCSIYSVPAPIGPFFGSAGVFNPTDGNATCGIAESVDHKTSSAGAPLTSNPAPLSTTFNNGVSSTFTGSAGASAQIGKLGAEAHGTFSGIFTSSTVVGAQALAQYSHTIIPHHVSIPDGQAGKIRLGITVDGTMTTDGGNTYADVEVSFQIDNGVSGTDGLLYNLIRGGLQGGPPFWVASWEPNSLNPPGFTQTPTSISGTGLIHTFEFDVVFGTPFDFMLVMAAIGIPYPPNHSVDVDFASTAEVTQIELYDQFHNALAADGFAFDCGAGIVCDANGVRLLAVTNVPEPAPLALIGAALIWLGSRRRR